MKQHEGIFEYDEAYYIMDEAYKRAFAEIHKCRKEAIKSTSFYTVNMASMHMSTLLHLVELAKEDIDDRANILEPDK